MSLDNSEKLQSKIRSIIASLDYAAPEARESVQRSVVLRLEDLVVSHDSQAEPILEEETDTPEFIDEVFEILTDDQYTEDVRLCRAATVVSMATGYPQTLSADYARRTLTLMHMSQVKAKAKRGRSDA